MSILKTTAIPQPLSNDGSITSFETAKKVFPDGTSRVTVSRNPYPRYLKSGKGAYVTDIDGNRFLDLNNNFTTLIHGHAFEPVITAIQKQLLDGTCFANPTTSEIELAELICTRVPNLDRIRFVNTGTEAVMFAVKAARAYTNKPMIAKMEGAYHGSYDPVEVSQHTGPDVWGDKSNPNKVPFYKGVPQSVLDEVVILNFNDIETSTALLIKYADKLACLLIDPMPSRAGLIAPEPEFLTAIQETCEKHNILIIADEVLNFRQSYQGASAKFGLKPDLITLGKIIGGGMPIGAIGGRKEIMQVFDASNGRPLLPQGGTFSANPLSMAAGLASMQALDKKAFAHLDHLGQYLRDGLTKIIQNHNANYNVTGSASLFRIHPSKMPPKGFRDIPTDAASQKTISNISAYFLKHHMLLPAGASACLSTAMSQTEMDDIISVFNQYLTEENQS